MSDENGVVSLTLPSGLQVRFRPPDKWWWVAHADVAHVAGPGEFKAVFAETWIVEPRVSRSPGPGEVSPASISFSDFNHLVRHCGPALAKQLAELQKIMGL